MNYEDKKIIILGGGDLQLPGILKAKEMGLQVIVCDYYEEDKCPGKKVPGVIGELVSTYDYEGVLEVAKKYNVDAITTLCTDYPMRVVAYVAEKLNLPGITYESAVRSTDKGLMRQCFKEHGIPSPQFEIVKSKEEYLSKVKEFKGKFVVKAADNSGSRGIELIDNPDDLKRIDEAYDYCVQFSRSGDIVIEEFMDGQEMCVDTLNFDENCYVIQVSDQRRKEPPYFTDSGYNAPSLLDAETVKKISEVTSAANIALGNTTGSSCTEVIVTKDGPKVVEVGPRLSGDYVASHLVPLSTGVDMVEGIIKIALGEKPDISQKFTKGAAVRYYMEPIVGRIKEIKGVEEAEKIEGIQMLHFNKKVGDMAVPLRESNDRIAVVVAQKDTPEEAIACCKKALDKIEIIVEE